MGNMRDDGDQNGDRIRVVSVHALVDVLPNLFMDERCRRGGCGAAGRAEIGDSCSYPPDVCQESLLDQPTGLLSCVFPSFVRVTPREGDVDVDGRVDSEKVERKILPSGTVLSLVSKDSIEELEVIFNRHTSNTDFRSTYPRGNAHSVRTDNLEAHMLQLLAQELQDCGKDVLEDREFAH